MRLLLLARFTHLAAERCQLALKNRGQRTSLEAELEFQLIHVDGNEELELAAHAFGRHAGDVKRDLALV